MSHTDASSYIKINYPSNESIKKLIDQSDPHIQS